VVKLETVENGMHINRNNGRVRETTHKVYTIEANSHSYRVTYAPGFFTATNPPRFEPGAIECSVEKDRVVIHGKKDWKFNILDEQ